LPTRRKLAAGARGFAPSLTAQSATKVVGAGEFGRAQQDHFKKLRRIDVLAATGAKLLLIMCLVTSLSAAALDDSSLAAISNLAAHQQWIQAAGQIELYRQSHPESVPAAVLQSEILIRLGLLSDANAILQRILSIHPHSIEALSASAELSRTLADKATAEQLLQRCTRYAPRSPETWKRLGDLYLSLGRKEALASFQRAAALAPDDPLVQAGMAAAYHQAGQDAQAEREFRRAIRLNDAAAKPDAMVNYLFAEFLQDKAQYRESVSQYGRALHRDPALMDAYLGRAKSLVRLQEWDRAEPDLQICLKDEERQIAALNLLTKIAQAQGKTEEAQHYAAQAEKLSSDAIAQKATNNQIASLLQNAHALMLAKNFVEAAASYQRLLHDYPVASEAWLDLGRCHVETGQIEEAESDVRHFLSLEDKSASGHVLLGRILLRQKQPSGARSEFTQAQRIDPLLAEAHLGIAASYILENNFPEAIITLRKLEALAGASTEARLMLTEALYKNHQPEEALREIDRLLKQDPANQAAQQMRNFLLQKTTMH
jgi:tetratricopeptide (TPR) repeat protein